jgi:hypothetical protein
MPYQVGSGAFTVIHGGTHVLCHSVNIAPISKPGKNTVLAVTGISKVMMRVRRYVMKVSKKRQTSLRLWRLNSAE